tara:strand:+ start:759 stop:989 length:231 start_codon:yes stop_codon:yes gene_type:complete
MPKIELIISTKLTGEGTKIHYFIRVDDKYLDNSISYDLEEAEKMLQFVKENIHVHNTEEVIEEIIVPEPNNDPKYF